MNLETNTELGNDTVPQLYDLSSDPGETRNIAASNPQQVRRMWNLILKDAGPKGLPKFPKGGGEG